MVALALAGLFLADPAVRREGPGQPGTSSQAGPSPVAPTAARLPDGTRATSILGSDLGDVATKQAFARALRQPSPVPPCLVDWARPPGVRELRLDLELQVRSEEGALVVEDAMVREASLGDAELERCITSGLRGRRVPAPGATPGRSFLVKWSIARSLD